MNESDNMGTILIMTGLEILSNKIKKLLTDHQFRNVEILSNYNYLSSKSKVFLEADMIVYDPDNRNLSLEDLKTMLKSNSSISKIPIIMLQKPLEENVLLEKVRQIQYQGREVEKPEKTPSLKTAKDSEAEESFITCGQIFDTHEIKLEWTKQYEIGIELIDQEHKLIIENYNQLYLAIYENKGKDYYGKVLEFLMEYVLIHFQHEEAIQEKMGYPNLNEHKKLHEAFRKQVNLLYSNYKEQNVSQKDLIIVCLFVKKWLLEHILIEDKKIGDFSLTK